MIQFQYSLKNSIFWGLLLSVFVLFLIVINNFLKKVSLYLDEVESEKYQDVKLLSFVKDSINIDKSDYKILIIDDDPIDSQFIKKLENRGYSITQVSDIDNFDGIKMFTIIVCDIDGVGKRFDSQYQGGYLIQKIKELYPLKYIIFFSGKSWDASFGKIIRLVDDTMMKMDPLDV